VASNEAVLRARALRRTMSPPEAKLWNLLRARPEGLKFRHQHPAGPYTLDFYCAAVRLGIEVDGISHDMGDNPARDERRTAWLLKQGIRIIRFAAQDAMRDPEAVVTAICQAAAAHPPHRKMGRGATRRVVEG
jgi:very-short-patch-repair endonuclease